MTKLVIDSDKCVGCGQCQERCGFKSVIHVNGSGKASFKAARAGCIDCLHCLMTCPNSAIALETEDARVLRLKDEELSPVLTRHSCRKFKRELPEKSVLEEIIRAANHAPRAYIEFSERRYLVVTGEKLKELRRFLLNRIERDASIFTMLSRMPFLTKGASKNLHELEWCFNMSVEANKKYEQLFQGAPAVVLVCGPDSIATSKANSEHALLQLMILAEEKKLGTCISGYIAGYGKQITRFLRLDKGESVFCGIMIGYPALEFRAFVKRDDTVVTWVE